MKTSKHITLKGRQCLIIDNKFTVIFKEDKYVVYNNIAKTQLNTIASFDAQPFIDAFNQSIYGIDLNAKLQADNNAFINSINDCYDTRELADVLDLTMVETASHWSDLHNGRSSHAVLISSKKEFEQFLKAIDHLNICGEFVELKRRAGEHHSTINSTYNDLEDYQKTIEKYISNDNNLFYKSKETEQEYLLERIKESDNLEDIRQIIADHDELEDGYYDCNGCLYLSDDDLNSENFTGYSHDVYSYNFGFYFEFDTKFNNNDEQ